MQAPEDALARLAVVVLHEAHPRHDLVEARFSPGLEEETAVVTVDSGLEDEDIGDCGWNDFHIEPL